jgi:hypothetical protein
MPYAGAGLSSAPSLAGKLAASLTVALLPVSGLIGAGETRAVFMVATVAHLRE